ncbi:MAG: SDR family NAD(P)-dependent oxidoreductase [Pseudomonadota bacterium]
MRSVFRTIGIVAVVLLAWANVAPAQESKTPKAVLITGATTGIGRVTAEHLAKAGYFVYAGARKQSDIDELNKIENIKAVRLDVTIQSDIDAAVELIEKEGRGLWGLVNNAGVNVVDPLIEADFEDFQFIFDVNVFGVFRVSKAFAPLVIESKGRIVNISSISGVLSGGFDGYGMYVASKHALEGLTDQMAWELGPLGVAVSSILPGGFASDIGKSRCKRMLQNQAKKTYRYFGKSMESYIDSCKARMSGEPMNIGPSPMPVALAIEQALFSESPREHYLVPGESDEARITIAKLLEEVAGLNVDADHSLSEDELLEIYRNEARIAQGKQPRTMPGFYDEQP